jgi:hypothetical protein
MEVKLCLKVSVLPLKILCIELDSLWENYNNNSG